MEYVDSIRITAAAFLLIVGAVMDIRHKKVALLLPVSFLCMGVIMKGYLLYMGRTTPEQCILSASVGIGMLILAAVFRGSMGYGDGLILLALGMYLPGEQILAATCIGIFLMAIGSGLLLVIKKVNRKTKIPFLPFLAASFFLTERMIK